MRSNEESSQQRAAELCAAAVEVEAAKLWDDAARRYEECLSLVAASPDGLGQDEAALLTALGRCYWKMAEARTAWRTLRRAIATYRERGDGAGAARATLELLRIWAPYDRKRAFAEEAMAALADEDVALRAQLLLWLDKTDDARALAEAHNVEPALVLLRQFKGWDAFRDGRYEEGVAILRQSHDEHLRLGDIDSAASALRGAGYALLEQGRLEDGEALAQATVDFARANSLRFYMQLAGTDELGVAFARCEFERCDEILQWLPGDTDFRGDLYRMWIAELRGTIGDVRLFLVDPERAGRTPDGMAQIHAGNAGVLYRAGLQGPARHELDAWAAAIGDRGFCHDITPALADCLVAYGDGALLRHVYEDFVGDRERVAENYATLQGRAIHPARGLLALRLGYAGPAEESFRDGLAWAERERCPLDAARCLQGLAEVAAGRGDAAEASVLLERAMTVYARHGAMLLVRQVAAQRDALGA